MNDSTLNHVDEEQCSAQCHHPPGRILESFAEGGKSKADQAEATCNQTSEQQNDCQQRDGLTGHIGQTHVKTGIHQQSVIAHFLKLRPVTFAILVLAALSANLTTLLAFVVSYGCFVLLFLLCRKHNGHCFCLATSDARLEAVDILRHIMLFLFSTAIIAAVFIHKTYLWDILWWVEVFSAYFCTRYDLSCWHRSRAIRAEAERAGGLS